MDVAPAPEHAPEAPPQPASTLDETSLSTIALLESRLLRLEHLLHGAAPPSSASPAEPPPPSTVRSVQDLQNRLSSLVQKTRVYSEILTIYKAHPDLFPSNTVSSATAAVPPSTLPTDALRAMVLASASAYPATASALTAVLHDTPVPEPHQSAALAALLPRMRAAQAVQAAQAAEVAALRARSERLVAAWYERGVVAASQAVASTETRVAAVDKAIRRRERAMDEV